MNSEEAYGIWAPRDSPWSQWVKPVLFASVPNWSAPDDGSLAECPEPTWLTSSDRSTAIVVDLPGAEGLLWGVALARRGWWPVPLYNAAPEDGFAQAPGQSFALVDVSAIVQAMRHATAILEQLASTPQSPPAFLLDAERRFGTGAMPMPGKFDNRSISLPTDFPSALFLRSRGIERVLLIQHSATAPQEDLAHTLCAWQDARLPIAVKSLTAGAEPVPLEVARPSNFRVMWYRLLATLGLKRNPLGGFGGTIPEPSAG